MTAPQRKATDPETPPRHNRIGWLVAVFVLLTLIIVAWSPVKAYLQATAVLLRIESSEAHGFFADQGIHPIHVQETTFAGGDGELRTRLYWPYGINRRPGMVIVHGVHHLGYNEPRLVRFAKAVSGAGVIVSTPELPEIAGYQIKSISVDEIAAAADDLASRLRTPCVGVLGLSFAGGLALEAASDPATNRHICYVVAVGAHDDMARVMKFFATDRAEYPDGSTQPMASHEYGALVAIYAHPEEYFPAADIPLARVAIREQLFEQMDQAKAAAAKMSPKGRAFMDKLFSGDHTVAKAILLRNLEKHREETDAVSPAPQLYRLHLPVLLLHGAGDNVIPPSETLWLARDIPAQSIHAVLISPAISHVELGKGATFWDKFRLVRFVVNMLGETKMSPYNNAEPPRMGAG